MSGAKNARGFIAYSFDILRYKKLITLANIFCNAIIFSHQAAVNFCVRQALNILEGAAGTGGAGTSVGAPGAGISGGAGNAGSSGGAALGAAAPYLGGILAVAAVRVAAIMGCGALDAQRSFYYQSRVRANIMQLLLKKGDVTRVAGRSGAVFEAFNSDVPISTFPAELLTEVSGHFIYTLIALTMLLAINWRLTLFIFLPLSAAIYGIQRLSERMKERRRENRAAHDAASSFISDVSGAVLAVKAAGAEAPVLSQYDAVNKNRRSAALKDTLLASKINVMLYGVVYAGSAIIMFAASRLMASGEFGIGDFSLFIANLGTLADSVNRIVELVAESRKAEVSYERILDIVGSDSAAGNTYTVGNGDESGASGLSGGGADAQCAGVGINAAELNANAGLSLRRETRNAKIARNRREYYSRKPLRSFEVKNLSFDYGDGHGFRDVSFHIGPGELVAVAGGVGSGKSALLGVLMGLMPPLGGEMLLDGAPFTFYERTPVKIAGAPQRGGFFSDSLSENLRLGFPASQDELLSALSIAALEELAAGDPQLANPDNNIPQGFDIDIGSRGGRLSGGQQQRLALARMLARGAQINVIDDCVSALDADTRRTILLRLSEYAKNTSRAVIIATNERVFLDAADNILLMERGRLAAQGSFAELQSFPAFRGLEAPNDAAMF